MSTKLKLRSLNEKCSSEIRQEEPAINEKSYVDAETPSELFARRLSHEGGKATEQPIALRRGSATGSRGKRKGNAARRQVI